ncbi:MAG: hypothetical protein JO006_12315 [Paucibacter sp.]|nr:hypothetical protein [Roseateles sp.]
MTPEPPVTLGEAHDCFFGVPVPQCDVLDAASLAVLIAGRDRSALALDRIESDLRRGLLTTSDDLEWIHGSIKDADGSVIEWRRTREGLATVRVTREQVRAWLERRRIDLPENNPARRWAHQAAEH